MTRRFYMLKSEEDLLPVFPSSQRGPTSCRFTVSGIVGPSLRWHASVVNFLPQITWSYAWLGA